MALLFSYVFGAAHASLTGLGLALTSKGGRFTYLAALGAALVSSVVVYWLAGSEGPSDILRLTILLGVVAVVTSLSLRWLFRGIFSPARDSIIPS